MHRLFRITFFILTLVHLSSAFAGQDLAAGPKDASVLIYYSGDNRLSDFMYSSYLRVLREGAGSQVNVLVQFDGEKEKDSFRAQIPSEKQNGEYRAKYFSKNVEYNMGKASTLVDFIKWGKKNFPARKTILVIMSHGYGILNNPFSDPNDVGRAGGSVDRMASSTDDSSHSFINEEDLATQLKPVLAGQKLDLVVLNSCLMGSLEVQTVLSQIAHHAIASEYSIYMNTNDDLKNDEARMILVEKIIGQLKANPKVSDQQIGHEVTVEFEKNYRSFVLPTDQQDIRHFPSTLAYVDLDQVSKLTLQYAKRLNEFEQAVYRDPKIFFGLLDRILKARYVDSFGYVDLRVLYKALTEALDKGNLTSEMQKFDQLLGTVVLERTEQYTEQAEPSALLHVFFPAFTSQGDLTPFLKSYGQIQTLQKYQLPSMLNYFWASVEKYQDAYWIAKLKAWNNGETVVVNPRSSDDSRDYDLFLQMDMAAIRMSKKKGKTELKAYTQILQGLTRKSEDLDKHVSFVKSMLQSH